MAEKVGDKFAQLAYLTATETAANTLTFAKLEVATGALLGKQKYGMVLHRIQFNLSIGTRKLILDEDDALRVAITTSSGISGIDLDNVDVVDNIVWGRSRYGTAASGWENIMPVVHDFANMGGILVPADRLYLAVVGTSLASAASASCRIWYTMRELSVDEYWDLVEARRIITT
jgi:hypothetical protein